ncbi:MAG: hypothetical protein M1816_003402 [Peltula sp. TS41687]|nr:MAG: hypothetical protein M1816_003402 [Peltula sp. TS41687]
MSGAEVAGLVLAGFPLLISALEHYQEGFRPLMEWWSFERKFGDFIVDLGIQQSRFELNIRKLVEPLAASDAEMNTLLNDYSSAAWRDPDLEMKLKERLQDSFEWYMARVNKMAEILEELKRMLHIEDGQVDWDQAGRRDYEMRRLRISFSKKKFKRIRTLADYNDELTKIIGLNDELAPSRRLRKRTPFMEYIRRIQDHACSLHGILKEGWRCPCRSPHTAILRLEKRIAEESSSNVFFRVRFGSEALSIPWHATEIRVLELGHPSTVSASSSSSSIKLMSELKRQLADKSIGPALRGSSTLVQKLTSYSNSVVNNGLVTITKTQTKKKARFLDPPQPLSALSTIPSDLSEIDDLCKAVQNWGPEHAGLGFLYDDQNRRHGIYSILEQQHGPNTRETVSLEGLLSGQHGGAAGNPLTRYERFTLAAILASSLLQLQTTPWLSETWSKQDILFLQGGENRRRAIIEHPYVAEQFVSSNLARRVETPTDTSPTAMNGCRKSIIALGIMLLELCFGEKLEDQPIRKKYLQQDGTPNDYTDLCTAKEWHERIYEEYGDALSDAIRRCLDCSFGPKPNFADDEFKQAIYSDVIEPIEKFLQLWSGGKAR